MRSVLAQAAPYPADAKPVFVGHYWLSAKQPEPGPETLPAWTTVLPRTDFGALTAGAASRR